MIKREIKEMETLVRQATIQVITTEEDLLKMATSVAETTAEKLINALHKDEKPIPENEACKLVGKTRQTLSKYRRKGIIRYHRIGGSILYYPSELTEDLKKL